MSVSQTTSKAYLQGNGVQTVFPFLFRAFATTDLVVYTYETVTKTLTELANAIDYSVTLAPVVSEGGSITLGSAPSATTEVIILRKQVVSQPTELEETSEFTLNQLEGQLDKIIMLIQELECQIARSAKVGINSQLSIKIPDPEDNFYLVWDGVTGQIKNVDIDLILTPLQDQITVNTNQLTAQLALIGVAQSTANTANSKADSNLASINANGVAILDLQTRVSNLETQAQNNEDNIAAHIASNTAHDTIYLNKQNTVPYAPTTLYHPATKGYVDTLVAGSIKDQFETVSKNLISYNTTINKNVGGDITSIVYTDGTNTITKTFNYTSGDLTSLVLSGAVPGGINLTKTFLYTSGEISGWTYS